MANSVGKFSRKLETPNEILSRWISENHKRFGVNNPYGYYMRDKKWYYYTYDVYMVYRDQVKKRFSYVKESKKESKILNDRINKYGNSNAVEIQLPSIDEVIRVIYDTNDREQRYGKTRPIFDFGEGLPAVNARYLRDILGLFEGTTAIAFAGTQRDPIYIYALKQEALLFPVRKF